MSIVNIAIQVLPKSKVKHEYDIVDEAIDIIKESGIKFQVCPFETVMEGKYDELMEVVKKVQEKCFNAGADELIINLKLQVRNKSDVTIDEKMEKYK